MTPTHELNNQVSPLCGDNRYETDAALREAVAREGAGWHDGALRVQGALLGSEEVERLAEDANRHPPEFVPFDRLGRRIQLTTAGEDLLGRSRDLLAQAESLRERARTLGGGVAGVLRVGATPQAMQSVLAGFLPRFQRARPGVDIRLIEEGGVRLFELVERGDEARRPFDHAR